MKAISCFDQELADGRILSVKHALGEENQRFPLEVGRKAYVSGTEGSAQMAPIGFARRD